MIGKRAGNAVTVAVAQQRVRTRPRNSSCSMISGSAACVITARISSRCCATLTLIALTPVRQRLDVTSGGEQSISLNRPIGHEPQDTVPFGGGARRALDVAAQLDLHVLRSVDVTREVELISNDSSGAWAHRGHHTSPRTGRTGPGLVGDSVVRHFAAATVGGGPNEDCGTVHGSIRSEKAVAVRFPLRHRIILASCGLHRSPQLVSPFWSFLRHDRLRADCMSDPVSRRPRAVDQVPRHPAVTAI